VGFLVTVELDGRFELFVAEAEEGNLEDRQKWSKNNTNSNNTHGHSYFPGPAS
jgi:hypothetical protein